MTRPLASMLLAVALAFAGPLPALAQQAPAPPAAPQPFTAGVPLKLTPNAKTYGGFRFAESISYDAERDV